MNLRIINHGYRPPINDSHTCVCHLHYRTNLYSCTDSSVFTIGNNKEIVYGSLDISVLQGNTDFEYFVVYIRKNKFIYEEGMKDRDKKY